MTATILVASILIVCGFWGTRSYFWLTILAMAVASCS